MCINPVNLPNGKQAACRKCWQCNGRKVDDWVGRCIAESRTATHTDSISLTYGRDEAGNTDHIRAVVLTYSDVQKFFKKLRFAGYKFRYFAVGEYGSRRGRAHWHLVMFWDGKRPDFKNGKEKWMFEPWQHGFTFVEPVVGSDGMNQAKAVRYVCKYVQKDNKDPEKNGHLSMSKKPPLGHEYFQGLAKRYVQQGLAPQTLEYSFPEVVDGKGRKKRFMMTGKTAENFLRAFVYEWLVTKSDFIPTSEIVEQYQDSLVEDDPIYHMMLEATKNGAKAREKAEKYLWDVEKQRIEERHGDVAAFFLTGDHVARTTDGEWIKRREPEVESGIDLTRSRNTQNKVGARSRT